MKRVPTATGTAPLFADEESFTFFHSEPDKTVGGEDIVNLQGVIWLHVSDIEAIIEKVRPDSKRPPKAQIRPNNGAGTLHRQVYLQHGYDALCRRKNHDSDAYVVFPGGRRTLFRDGGVHDPWRTLADCHLPVRRAGVHR